MGGRVNVVDVVRSVVGRGPIKLLPDRLTGSDNEMVLATLQKDRLGYGAILAFETMLASAVGGGIKALAVSSGTAALHLVVKALDIGPGAEVLMPTLTFAGAAAAVKYTGAVPHFIDCRSSPLGSINTFKLRQYWAGMSKERRDRIKALMAVDLLGHPGIDLELAYFCGGVGIALIEDAAGALGSICEDGAHCGTVADAAIFSFNSNKIVTTGQGGAVLTSKDKLLERCRDLATTAKDPSPWFYEMHDVGFNYRMANINAALGLAQLGRLEESVAFKWDRHRRYAEALDGRVITASEQTRPNHWLTAMKIESSERFDTMRALLAAGIESRALYTPLHLTEPYKACPRMPNLDVAEDLWRRTICLPS